MKQEITIITKHQQHKNKQTNDQTTTNQTKNVHDNQPQGKQISMGKL